MRTPLVGLVQEQEQRKSCRWRSHGGFMRRTNLFRLFGASTNETTRRADETAVQRAAATVASAFLAPLQLLTGSLMRAFPSLSLLACIVAATFSLNAHSQASEVSALSAVPIAVLSAAPVAIVSSGANLTVRAVEASVGGTTWVLERASDGARASVRLAGGASVAVGTSVVATAVTAGTVLSVAGQVIAFIPNEVGAALLHNERVTP